MQAIKNDLKWKMTWNQPVTDFFYAELKILYEYETCIISSIMNKCKKKKERIKNYMRVFVNLYEFI